MAMPPFERLHLGLSRFAELQPILLRAGLLLLFFWYDIELFCNATGFWPSLFLVVLGPLLLLIFLVVMVFTYLKYSKDEAPADPSSTTRLWPFLLINVFMILLVSVIAKWEQHRGAPGFTTGLLGFTQVWVQKIGVLLSGGR